MEKVFSGLIFPFYFPDNVRMKSAAMALFKIISSKSGRAGQTYVAVYKRLHHHSLQNVPNCYGNYSQR